MKFDEKKFQAERALEALKMIAKDKKVRELVQTMILEDEKALQKIKSIDQIKAYAFNKNKTKPKPSLKAYAKKHDKGPGLSNRIAMDKARYTKD